MKRSNAIRLLFLALPVLAAMGGAAVYPFAAAANAPAPAAPAQLPTEDGLLSLSDEPLPPVDNSTAAPAVPQNPVNPLVVSPAPTDAVAPPAPYDAPQQNAPEANALPDPMDIVSSPEDTGFKPSYGGWPYSIMYPSTEIANLKNILALYERKGFIVDQAAETAPEEAKPTIDDLYKKLQEKPLPPNMVYPSFRLRSIVHRGANEWSVWLNNRHISNDTNKPENEIVVVSVNKEFAEFAWIPTNAELLSAILQLRLLPEGSRPKLSETPKHRKATSDRSEGWLDKSTSVVHFILRPNQTFYSETFEVFEGVPDSISASMSRAIQLETEPNSSPITPENDPTQIIKDLQKQLDEQKQAGEQQPPAEAEAPATLEQKTNEIIDQKQNPKAQMMRTLGLGK